MQSLSDLGDGGTVPRHLNGAQLLKYGLKEEVEIPTDFKVQRMAVETDGDLLDKEADQADIDDIFDRVETLEGNQLSVEYDKKSEGLILKKGNR